MAAHIVIADGFKGDDVAGECDAGSPSDALTLAHGRPGGGRASPYLRRDLQGQKSRTRASSRHLSWSVNNFYKIIHRLITGFGGAFRGQFVRILNRGFGEL
jgi:hypothetical protein